MNPLSINVLEKSKNCILYELPAGKPNKKQPCTVGEDTRDRVIQSAVKGNACWYYTLNFLRHRIGKNPCEQLVRNREIEIICSSRNKAQIKHYESLPFLATTLDTDENKKELQGINKPIAQTLLPKKAGFETPESLNGRPSLYPYIVAFVNQNKHENLHAFLLHTAFEKRNEINENFLLQLGVNTEYLYETQMQIEPELRDITWEKLNIVVRSSLLNVFVRNGSAEAYGLKRSTWKPNKGVECLINELNINGPLFVIGHIGKAFYKEAPFVMKQTFSGRKIYAWKPGAERISETYLAHSVLLVGAKKVNDNGYVFFIDSLDPSDPNDRSLQKIYLISFTNLTQNIRDLRGFSMVKSTFGYAYHGNFNLLN